MTEVDMRVLAKLSPFLAFTQGETIIRNGDSPEKGMYLVLLGEVEVYKDYNTSKETLIKTAKADEPIGEVGFFTNSAQGITAIAKGTVTVVCITKENFADIYKEFRFIIIQIMMIVCKSESKVVNQLIEAVNSPYVPKLDLYPEGHTRFNVEQPESYKNYITKDIFTCPYCHKEHQTMIPLTSKVKYVGETSADFRRRSNDFELSWYDVTTCPHCYYSSLTDYLMYPDNIYFYMRPIKERLDLIHKLLPLKFSEPRTLDQVFDSYYLALACAPSLKNSKQVTAMLWLRLSWLYSDYSDQKMTAYATKKAYEHYVDFYGNTNLTPKQEQYFCLIMGHLALVTEDFNASYRYLSEARLNKAGSAIYTHMATMELEKLRELRREKDLK